MRLAGIAGHEQVEIEGTPEAVGGIDGTEEALGGTGHAEIGDECANELPIGTRGIASGRVKVLVVDL